MPLRAPSDVASRAPWRRALAALALVAAALPAAAQAPDTPPLLDADTRVLPVWSNASGRVEALLLLDPVDPALPASSLDRVLRAQAPALGLGGRVTLQGGAELRGSLQLESDSGLALLCEGRRGLAATLGSLGERCLLASLGHEDMLLGGRGRGARLELGWQSPGQDLDLSFGLSWLDYAPSVATLAGGSALLPVDAFGRGLDSPTAWFGALQTRGLHLDGLITLGPRTRVLLGGDVGRNQLLGADGMPLRWDTAALSFGLGFGDFTGQLTGRLVELPRGNQWSTLDIGLSWRTPWRGELSVGAKNVLGGADTAAWPLAELPAIEDSASRVPYVRYQQDL
jgi:hypothetical protein